MEITEAAKEINKLDYDCNCTYWSNIDAVIYDHFEDQIGF